MGASGAAVVITASEEGEVASGAEPSVPLAEAYAKRKAAAAAGRAKQAPVVCSPARAAAPAVVTEAVLAGPGLVTEAIEGTGGGEEESSSFEGMQGAGGGAEFKALPAGAEVPGAELVCYAGPGLRARAADEDIPGAELDEWAAAGAHRRARRPPPLPARAASSLHPPPQSHVGKRASGGGDPADVEMVRCGAAGAIDRASQVPEHRCSKKQTSMICAKTSSRC